MKKKIARVPSSSTKHSVREKPSHSSRSNRTAAVLQEASSRSNAFDYYHDLRTYVRDRAAYVYLDGLGRCYSEKPEQKIPYADLRQICIRYGIDYQQDIRPVFVEKFIAASFLPTEKKAQVEAKKQYTHWWRRYRGFLQGVTQEQSPLPPELKKVLYAVSRFLPQPSLIEDLVGNEPPEAVNKLLGTTGRTALIFTSKTKPHRHPAWRDLQKELFRFLTQKKKLTRAKAINLISDLLDKLLPSWAKVENPKATLLQNLKYPRKEKP